LAFVALETIAEVGVALAGFAALAGAIRGNAIDSEAIFGVVVNGAVALAFSLLALRFGDSIAGVRILAGILALVSVSVALRGIQIVLVSFRSGGTERDPVGDVFGTLAFLGLLLAPPISLVVAFGFHPAEAELLYESALLCHLAIALFLFLYVVWRNFAARQTSALAALQGVEPDAE
jgi:hypothetical protein